ncbi:hypothetical protein ACGH6Q_11370 [Gilliamella sp. BG2]|uniref:hypothetical protein n=1 Tax=Gilliamella sp. BG2 TaxID=3351509 RepID=UPI003988107C
MLKFLYINLFIILLPYVAYASDINLAKNNYYMLMKDNLSEQLLQTKEGKLLVTKLDNLIFLNQDKIVLWGCDFKQMKESWEDINKQLNQSDFFKDYDNELRKHHLTFRNFIKVYTNDRNSSSNICNSSDHMNIILLDNNNLMIPYENELIFFKRLSEEQENNINNYHNNVKCLETKRVDMDITDICYYQNMTILDVYEAMSFDPSNLFRKKIKQGEDFSDIYEDDYMRVEVEYKWKGKNKLEIAQYFDGGETYYTFVNQGNRTKLITKLSPD